MVMKTFLSAILSLVLFGAMLMSAGDKATGPANAAGEVVTGAPDELDCNKCHDAEVILKEATLTYKPLSEDIYRMELAVPTNNISIVYGFQGTALNQDNLKAGVIIPKDSTNSQLTTIGVRDYLEHKYEEPIPLDDTVRIQFDWINYNKDDKVTFYFNTLLSNYDGTPNGDIVIKTQTTFHKPDVPKIAQIGFKQLEISHNKPFSIKVYDILGKTYQTYVSDPISNTINLHINGSSNLYFFSFFNAEGTLFYSTKRFIL
jgi:hypothetical protein